VYNGKQVVIGNVCSLMFLCMFLMVHFELGKFVCFVSIWYFCRMLRTSQMHIVLLTRTASRLHRTAHKISLSAGTPQRRVPRHRLSPDWTRTTCWRLNRHCCCCCCCWWWWW